MTPVGGNDQDLDEIGDSWLVARFPETSESGLGFRYRRARRQHLDAGLDFEIILMDSSPFTRQGAQGPASYFG